MASAVDPHYYIPPDWIPITAIEKSDYHGHIFQNVYVPKRWIPETRSKVVVCCYPLEAMEWDDMPDHIRYIFGDIYSKDKNSDADYDEVMNTLEECQAVESADRFIGELNIMSALPSYDIETLDKEELEKHVVVVCSFLDQDGIDLVAKCDIAPEKKPPNENPIPNNNDIDKGDD